MIGRVGKKLAWMAAAGLLVSLVARPSAGTDMPKLPAGYTCETVVAYFRLVPPSWTEQQVKDYVTKLLRFSVRDYREAKKCIPAG